MSDIIKVRKENHHVVAERIISDIHYSEVLDYVRKEYQPTKNYKRYGFDKSILGIGLGKDCVFPIDNSNNFFGYSKDGLIMICLHLEDAESYGESLYLMYDDEECTEDIITFIKK